MTVKFWSAGVTYCKWTSLRLKHITSSLHMIFIKIVYKIRQDYFGKCKRDHDHPTPLKKKTKAKQNKTKHTKPNQNKTNKTKQKQNKKRKLTKTIKFCIMSSSIFPLQRFSQNWKWNILRYISTHISLSHNYHEVVNFEIINIQTVYGSCYYGL